MGELEKELRRDLENSEADLAGKSIEVARRAVVGLKL